MSIDHSRRLSLLRRLLYVAFFLEVGLLLIVLPWSGYWERNYFASIWPVVRAAVTNNFVRGAISGLGVVNVVTGFAELLPLFVLRERSDVSMSARGPESPSYPSTPNTQVER